MKPSNHQFPRTRAHLVLAALVTTLTFAPCAVFAKDKDAHEDRAELRIKDMHAKLMITATQEEQWSKVAESMSENAKVMDRLTQARSEHAKEMTAIDDLKSYGEIAEAHAEGIRKLTPVFATLYVGMSDVQKKEADLLFRHGNRKHGDHKRADKLSSAK